jgi:hypothetical protein
MIDSKKLFDKRIIERNIKAKLLSAKDYDKYLKELNDLENNLEEIEITDEESEEMPKTSDFTNI